MEELNQTQNPNIEPEKPRPIEPTKQNWIWLGVITIITIAVVLIVWKYFGPIAENPVIQPTPTPTPTPETQVNLEEDALNVDLGNLDSEFQEIDNDLNGL